MCLLGKTSWGHNTQHSFFIHYQLQAASESAKQGPESNCQPPITLEARQKHLHLAESLHANVLLADFPAVLFHICNFDICNEIQTKILMDGNKSQLRKAIL